MKVLEVLYMNADACGPTAVLKNVVPYLQNDGIKIYLFSPFRFYENAKKIADDLGCTYYYAKRNGILTQKEILRSVPDFKEFDLIHIHGVYTPCFWTLSHLADKLKIPYVISVHGNLMKESLFKSKLKKKIAIHLFIQRMLKHAKMIHVMSKEEGRELCRYVCRKRLFFIYNGVAAEYEKKEYKEDRLRILFIGRIDVYHKGLDVLLDVMKELDKNAVELYLVGPYERKSDRKYIEHALRRGLSGKVFLEGAKYGLQKEFYYEHCNLFVHTSRYEGMPMAVLEAIAAGMPVIVTKQTNMGEIVQKAGAGYVAEFDKKKISDMINIILKDTSDLRKKGESGRRWALHELNWKKLSKRYAVMYHKAIAVSDKGEF